MSHKVLILPGDGIGPEILAATEIVIQALKDRFGLDIELEHALMGGIAYDQYGDPLPERHWNWQNLRTLCYSALLATRNGTK